MEHMLVLTQVAVSQNICCHVSLLQYDGTFADHLEMFIQLGYVVLFSSAFPMAAFCALMNNLIEIRSDAFKLCFTFQRPFGQRVSNIGTWQVRRLNFQLTLVKQGCLYVTLNMVLVDSMQV
jgi:anoctamin-8